MGIFICYSSNSFINLQKKDIKIINLINIIIRYKTLINCKYNEKIDFLDLKYFFFKKSLFSITISYKYNLFQNQFFYKIKKKFLLYN